MNKKTLEQLRNSLAQQGYSRRYIRMLVGELEDHCRCIIEAQTGMANEPAEENFDLGRIGTAAEIAKAVVEFPELEPLPRRHPWIAFIGLPSILLLVVTLLIVWLAHLLSDALPHGSDRLFHSLVGSVVGVQYLFPILVVATTCLIAIRARVPLWFPIISAITMLATIFFNVELAYCVSTRSLVCFQNWGIDTMKFSFIVGVLVTFLSYALLLEHSPIRATREYFGWRKSLGAVLFLILMFTAFYATSTETAQVVQGHPYDDIIVSQRQPHCRAASVNAILQSQTARDDLDLTVEQIAHFDSLFAQFKVSLRDLENDWIQKNPNQKFHVPFAMTGLKQLVLTTHQSALEQLDFNQKSRLRQLEYQSMGWSIVYEEAIQNQLFLTPQQINRFKDLEIERIKTRNRLTNLRRKADTENRSAIVNQYQNSLENFDKRFLQLLSHRQQKKRERLLGPPAAL